LGFDSSLLGSLRFFGTTGIRLEKVDYEVASQAEKVTRYLACWARYIDELSEEIYEAEKPTLGIAFFTWLSMTLGGFKNRSFHEEQEYRLISRAWTPQEIGVDSYWFRPSEEGLIVPYGPMSPEAGHLPLKEIWIGPTAEPHLAAFSLAELVSSNGFDVGPNGIVIRDSEIPLR
jgi:hypothetical protein